MSRTLGARCWRSSPAGTCCPSALRSKQSLSDCHERRGIPPRSPRRPRSIKTAASIRAPHGFPTAAPILPRTRTSALTKYFSSRTAMKNQGKEITRHGIGSLHAVPPSGGLGTRRKTAFCENPLLTRTHFWLLAVSRRKRKELGKAQLKICFLTGTGCPNALRNLESEHFKSQQPDTKASDSGTSGVSQPPPAPAVRTVAPWHRRRRKQSQSPPRDTAATGDFGLVLRKHRLP